jgi:hypothetical protein
MKRILENYRLHLNKEALFRIVPAILLLFTSLFINYHAGNYATNVASNSVSDVILSNIPVYDVDFVFVYGALFFVLFVIGLTLIDPKRVPFTLNAISLFTIIRAVFISLTHIGPFPSHIQVYDHTFYNLFDSSGSLFFWKDKPARYIGICASLFFGTIVLLGHLHYTIDVFAAFFMTYAIYHLAEFLFKKDRDAFYDGYPNKC